MAGVLERVDMVNFMCHDRLTIDLGPQLNFIIGHNGSGKSAILTAITIALGAKASSTSRGSSVKSFVKQGKSQAIIEVRIKNAGIDAYQHDRFGDRIIVERVIRADGGGAWKIKNSTGHIVSTKREELDNICDHCNIQVDNPLNILTQDSARQFLTSSSPATMYDFFLRGTHLSQLSNEYDVIQYNIDRIHSSILQKRESVRELHATAQEGEERYNILKNALEQQRGLNDLKNEVVWSQVREKEEEMKEAAVALERSKIKKERVQAEVAACEEKIRAHEDELERLEQQMNIQKNEDTPLREERSQLKTTISGFTTDLRRLTDTIQAFNAQFSRADAQIKDTTDRIEKEERDAAGGRDSRRNALLDRRKQLELERKKIEKQIGEHQDRFLELDDEINRVSHEKGEQEKLRDQTRKTIGTLESHIRELKSAKLNHLAAYGPNMPKLMDLVRAETRWRGKVVGPIGSKVRLSRQNQKWAHVLESVIGNTLNAFCVTNHHDMNLLLSLKERANCREVTIITGSEEMFDFTSGEPDEDILTVLRVLDIEDEFIKRQLINAISVERCALVEKRVDGDRLLRSRPKNVRMAYSSDLFRLQFSEAGSSTQTLQPYRGPPRLSADVDEQLARATRQKPEHEFALQNIQREIERLRNELVQLQEEKQTLRTRLPELKRQAQSKHSEEERVGEDLHQDQPTNIAALREALVEFERSREEINERFNVCFEERREMEEKIAPFLKRRKEVEQILRTREAERETEDPKMHDAAENRMKENNNHMHYLKKLGESDAKVRDREKHLNILERQYKQYLDDARKFCPQVELRKKPDTDEFLTTEEYNKLIAATEAKVKRAAQQEGNDIEAIAREVRQRQGAYANAMEEMKAFQATRKLLKDALAIRVSKWFHFRRHIALRSKNNFSHYLSIRKYEGTLKFKHEQGRLSLSVKTDAALGSEGDKDPRSLSGGEKSYSTICLLLSLWDAIGSPIRCLDEYDVFMDAVNRRVSTKLIADAAKKSVGVQYILISPNSMQHAALGPEVRIHRLQDPERGQTTL
ncbi:P-loop containing nucleoside triphosphate hydrolase protein [Meira miltonrushii]|uniref:P-loop containing nucleoside triphosphate hydrolase protein n=1 Tax=Meira miltonrushii TaxID=1280837 RepID=A0A316VMR1_9BASI|nr:P-loop containing nucleoside triphosphate hydrolase protein [Meira miltonrushii]PWN36845.1 P-loop containing nucleoside triphosphate hydrolase protein [Meira miltonrushii]